MITVLLVAAKLIVLHTVDGREVTIAPDQVTQLTASKDGTPNKMLVEAGKCVIGLTDGRFVTVAERCSAVRQLLENNR